MAKLESNLKNMLLSLTLISLVAAGVLAGVYSITKDPIAATEAAKKAEAKQNVLPKMEGLEVDAAGDTINDLIIYRAYVGEELVGCAVEVPGKGFGGEFRLMVGFDTEGKVTGFDVLKHQETPGLGAKMKEWFSTDKGHQLLAGHTPAKTQVVKTGENAAEGNEPLDAITAATISSKAFLEAVQKAAEGIVNVNVNENVNENENVDVNEEEIVEPTNVEE